MLLIIAILFVSITAQSFDSNSNSAVLDNSSAIWQNPAGLSFINGHEFSLGYAFKNNNNNFNTDANLNIAKKLNLAFGFSHTTTNNLVFGSAFKISPNFGFGLSTFKTLNKNNDFLFSAGLINRPSSWMSLGFYYQEINNNFFSPANLIAGIAFRPLKELLTIGLDNKFLPKNTQWKDGFNYNPKLSLQTDVYGISATIASELPHSNYSKPIFSLALEFNFNHFGFGAFSAFEQSTKHYLVGSKIRFSTQEWPSMLASKKWVNLELDSHGSIMSKPQNFANQLLANNYTDPLEILNSLENIAHDNLINGVIIKLNGLHFGTAKAQELRNALLKIKNNNKKIIIHLKNASETDYFIASSADTILMDPNATIDFNGFKSNLIYLADTFKKIGIKADAIAAGDYKTAPRMFTNNRPQKEELEVAENILNSFYQDVLTQVSLARNIDKAKLIALFDQGEITANQAKEAGLVDNLIYSEENFLENINIKNNYHIKNTKSISWQPAKTLAVLKIYGSIISGRVYPKLFSLLNERQVGSQDVADSIEEVLNNPNISGVLVHVNSPGGSVEGSNEIYRYIKKLSDSKPVVISMSDMAASGGYMAALGSQHIFANNNTLTGSVGVFSLSFEAQELKNKLGIFTQELSMIKNPDHDIFRSMTPEEKNTKQSIINWQYDQFVDLMSQNMKIDKPKAYELAQGRVWLGLEAYERGMIHNLGGFNEALNKLKELSNFQPNEDYDLVIISPGSYNNLGFMNLMSGSSLLQEFQSLSKKTQARAYLFDTYKK